MENMFTAISIETEGVASIKSILSCTQQETISDQECVLLLVLVILTLIFKSYKQHCYFKFSEEQHFFQRGMFTQFHHLLYLHSWNICPSNLAFQLLLCIVLSASRQYCEK